MKRPKSRNGSRPADVCCVASNASSSYRRKRQATLIRTIDTFFKAAEK